MPRSPVGKTGARGNGDRGRPAGKRRGSPSLRVYENLLSRILSGELAPGSHLSQQSIAASLETSQSPVISALRRLATERLVRYESGRGFQVVDVTPERFEDLLTVRRALETETARLAARRAGREDLEQLYRLVERMAEAVSQGRREDAEDADIELHRTIARLSRSPGLIEALQQYHFLDVLRRRRSPQDDRHGIFRNLAANHRKLVDAIATGDPDQAAAMMHAHLSAR